MALEIRTIRENEFERYAFIGDYAFGAEHSPESVARLRRQYRIEWILGAFEDGEMAAGLTIIPFAMRIDGRSIPMGGVASVASLPENRRQGYVGALLRDALARMRDGGQALSALYTPHPALYRRFGWAHASSRLEYRFACKDVDLYGAPPAGRARRVDRSAIPRLDEIYRAWSADRTGALDRSAHWWESRVFSRFGSEFNAAVWENGSGTWEGYTVYRAWQPPWELGQGMRMYVREVVTRTPEAYTGLVRYLLHHDLVADASWPAPPDDPFLTMVTAPDKVEAARRQGFMLRLVDVPAALAARPYPADGELILEVRDQAAPWNAGRWRLIVHDGEAAVEPSGDAPDLALDAAVLATLFDGYVSASATALTGLLDARSPEALAVADHLFATASPPHMSDGF